MRRFLTLLAGTTAALIGWKAQAQPRVNEIRIEGQDKIGVDAIRYRLTHPAGAPLDLRTVSSDIQALYGMGYFEEVTALVDPDRSAPEVTLVYRVREKPSIRTLKIEGFEEFEEAKLREAIKLKEHEIFSESKAKESVEAIAQKYAEEGYYLTNIEVRTEPLPNNQVAVTMAIDERDPVRVRRIVFLGNTAFSDAELLRTVEGAEGSEEAGDWSWLTGSGKYHEAALERDVNILRQWYLNHGYKDIKVEPAEVELAPDKTGIYLAYRLEEGEPYFVKSVALDGEILFDRPALQEGLKLKPGEVFNQSLLVEDLNALTDKYSDKGFAFADVDPRLVYDDAAHTVEITHRIARGDLVYFDKFHITGNVKTYDRVVRRVLAIHEGQLYNGVALAESRRRVQSLGFFKEVNFLTEPNADRSGMDVKIGVIEGPTGSLNVGVGYSSVDRLIGNAQVSQGNLFGTGQTLRFSGQISSRRRSFDVFYSEPYLFDSFWSFSVRLFNEERILPNFTRRSNGGQTTFGYRLTFNTQASLSYNYTATRTTLEGAAGSFVGDTDDTVGSVTAGLNRSTKNHPWDPTDGTEVGGSVETARREFGGGLEFMKFGGLARAFLTPLWKLTASGGATIRYASTFDRTAMPFSERYFTGGINSVRGYEFGSLGPVREVPRTLSPDFETSAREAGGNKELLFNFELLFPIIEEVGVKGVAFYDAGNVFAEADPYELSALRQGYGFGFRWFSPLGPLRFEWGFPIARRPGERAGVFEFTIGTFF